MSSMRRYRPSVKVLECRTVLTPILNNPLGQVILPTAPSRVAVQTNGFSAWLATHQNEIVSAPRSVSNSQPAPTVAAHAVPLSGATIVGIPMPSGGSTFIPRGQTEDFALSQNSIASFAPT